MEGQNFSITIDYDKNEGRPSRVFESMASIITAFEVLDKQLVKHLNNKIETVMLLEDIEKGSLRTVLANLIKAIPDQAIETLDYKRIIGHYLLKSKYIVLNALEGTTLLTDGKEIDTIEYQLHKAAEETGVDQIPTYVPVTKKTIIKNIDTLNKATAALSENDSVKYEYGEKGASFNLLMKMDYDGLEDLITNEVYTNNSRMVLKIRKPDYLGESKWSFRHGGKPLDAKITDTEWLFKFKNREIDVRPQDALVCEVVITAKYDHDNNLLGNSYEIVKVLSVRGANSSQIDMFKG